MIALPLLTIVADGVGLAGGALLCKWLLDIPIIQYVARVQDAISSTTFWAGLVKAPVFAILIAFGNGFASWLEWNAHGRDEALRLRRRGHAHY